MRIPWLRRSFRARRWLDRVFLDMPDWAIRASTGRRHWPPYSLRSFVGGAQRFDEVGSWFLEEFRALGLFRPGIHILDIGCGCGRLAYTLAIDPALRELGVAYTGMDVDRASIRWCQRHIAPLNPRFDFYQADCFNPSYNPHGAMHASHYTFPHADSSFNVILLTSVLTHALEEDLCQYLSEVARLLSPGGVAYASFFLFGDTREAAAGLKRHGIRFPFVRGHCAVNRDDYPTNAVAYPEAFVRLTAQKVGLRAIEPTRYGIQDLLLFERP